jgi:hypothetical protein
VQKGIGNIFLQLAVPQLFVRLAIAQAQDTVLPDGTHIFKPKIPIWVNFGRPIDVVFLWPFRLLTYITASSYIL